MKDKGRGSYRNFVVMLHEKEEYPECIGVYDGWLPAVGAIYDRLMVMADLQKGLSIHLLSLPKLIDEEKNIYRADFTYSDKPAVEQATAYFTIHYNRENKRMKWLHKEQKKRRKKRWQEEIMQKARKEHLDYLPDFTDFTERYEEFLKVKKED